MGCGCVCGVRVCGWVGGWCMCVCGSGGRVGGLAGAWGGSERVGGWGGEGWGGLFRVGRWTRQKLVSGWVREDECVAGCECGGEAGSGWVGV